MIYASVRKCVQDRGCHAIQFFLPCRYDIFSHHRKQSGGCTIEDGSSYGRSPFSISTRSCTEISVSFETFLQLYSFRLRGSAIFAHISIIILIYLAIFSIGSYIFKENRAANIRCKLTRKLRRQCNLRILPILRKAKCQRRPAARRICLTPHRRACKNGGFVVQ